MDLKKILEMLGVDKLEEGKQDEVKQGLETVIEARAKEQAGEQLSEQKDQLITEMEERFDEYKKDITSKFSNFVDNILEEELVIPDKVMEFARKGELYADLIEQFKLRLSIDEGLLDAEIKDLLREAKEEIVKHREEIDSLMADKLDLEMKQQELEAHMYLRKKSDGLTETQKMRINDLMEGITDLEEIDRKFDLIVESIRLQEQEDDEEDEEDDEEEEEYDEDEMKKKKKKKKKKGDDEEMEEGHSEVEDDEKDLLNEDEKEDSPFKEYLQVLREKKW
jgi:hypothetical protein